MNEPSPSYQQVIIGLWKLQNRLSTTINRITENESLSQVSVTLLFYLSLSGQAKITEIANIFCITPSAATAMVDKLEEEFLVERQKNKEDRRVVWVILTEKGHERINKLFSRWEEDELTKYGNTLIDAVEMLDNTSNLE